MSRALAVAALTALLITAAAPAAARAATVHGQTSQGKGVRVTYAGGYALRMVVNWKAGCGALGAYSSSTLFRFADGNATRDGIMSDRAYSARLGKGVRAVIHPHLRGTRAGQGWRGTLDLSASISRNGHTAGSCRLGLVSWHAGSAAPASAAKRFTGVTSQRRIATLVTGADGVPAAIRIAYVARCGDGSSFFDTVAFGAPLDAASADGVQDAWTDNESATSGHNKGEHYAITAALAGTRGVAGAAEHWQGTLMMSIVVRKHGKVTTRCRMAKPVGWSAEAL
jgi:hypothetical protein